MSHDPEAIASASHRGSPAPAPGPLPASSFSNKAVWLWLAAILLAFALYPALTRDIGGLAWDAALEHVPRGVVFSDIISDGVLYPRWAQSLHLGLGSPLFTFQPPLPYYGLDLLFRIGLPHSDGWRILMAAGLMLAFVGAYLLVREITGRRWPALVAATAFLYAPYVLRNSLERGSNEAFSMLLYPLVLWSLIWVARQPTAGRFLLATLIWAACIASHVLGPLMLFPFALALAGWLTWRKRTWAPLGVLLAGGLLTAAIWAPMIPEQAWVHVERDFEQPEAIPALNPIPLDALLSLPAVPDILRDNNGTGDRIGLLHTAGLLLGFLAALYAWPRNRRLAGALLLGSLAGVLLLWLFTAGSDPVWRAAGPLLGRLLYRTRLMGIQALAAAVVLGFLTALLPARWQKPAALTLIALAILSAFPALYPELQHRYVTFTPPVDLAQVRAIEIRLGGSALTAFGEFTPRWRTDPFDDVFLKELGADFDAQADPLAGPPAGVQVQSARVRNQAWDLTLDATQPSAVTLHLLYYPRWQAFVDGQPADLSPQAETGYAQVRIPAGVHSIALRYGRTPAETFGLAVSAAVALALIGLGAWAAVHRRDRGAGSRTATQAADRAPHWWLLIALTGLLLVKWFYVDTATTWFRCRSTPERACGIAATTNVTFPDAPDLRGYTAPATVRRGEKLPVTLLWQSDAPIGRTVVAFIHMRNSQKDWPMNPETGQDIWAQEDRIGPGGFFTKEHAPGKLYRDEYRVLIPEDMPPGEYFLEVGWYDLETGEQVDPAPESVAPPLRVLWRSILLPSIVVE
jgi:hypothetical protein